jgi:hypothetical protein
MSSLRYHGLGGGWDTLTAVLAPWTAKESYDTAKRTSRREDAIARAEQRRIDLEQQQASVVEQQKFQALADLQIKVASKLDQLEEQAEIATSVVLKIREAATAPILQGSKILEELEVALADMEKAVIAIQAGTVVDTASFDSAILSESYSNAAAALIAMKTVTSRGFGIQKDLEAKIQDLRDEQIRLQLAEERAAEERAVAARRERQLEEQRRADQAARVADAERQHRRDIMARVLALRAELAQEKRALSAARTELENLQFARAERLARAQESQARAGLSGWFR